MWKKAGTVLIIICVAVMVFAMPAFAGERGETTVGIEVIPGRPQRDVAVRVEDVSGAAVAGASVYVTFHTGEKFMGMTDAGGEKTILLLDGTYAYRITKVGFLEKKGTVTVSGSTSLSVTLAAQPSATPSPTSQPTMQPTNTQAPAAPTNNNGGGETSNNAAGTRRPQVSTSPPLSASPSPSASPSVSAPPTVSPGAESGAIANLGVHVLYTDGRPASGKTVELHSRVQSAVSNGDGWARFQNVACGEHGVVVKDENGKTMGSTSFHLTKGDATSVVTDAAGNVTLTVNTQVETIAVHIAVDEEKGVCTVSRLEENGVPGEVLSGQDAEDTLSADTGAELEKTSPCLIFGIPCWLFWLIIAIAIVIALILIVLLIRRKRNREKDGEYH